MRTEQPDINLQSLIDSLATPTVIIDDQYHIVAANAAYCGSYATQPSAILGRTCHEISHHSPVPCHQNGEDCPHQRVFSTNAPFEVLHTHYHGDDSPDHVRIKAHPLTGANGKRYMIEGIIQLAPTQELSCEDMQMAGKSPALLACIENLQLAARTDAPVLVYGESGVGKELAAHFVHNQSPRKGRAYIAVNCAAIPETLFESELFGHERGAFTGCVGFKAGLVEQAGGGTLFLDEIGELPWAMQAKLLRFLDSGEFRRIGGKENRRVDVRIIAATNRILNSLVESGQFREDLYYRIAGIRVSIPPLRERLEDIPMLVQMLVSRLCKRGAGAACVLTPAVLRRLADYSFPGNVRELRNILQRAVAASPDGVIREEYLHLDAMDRSEFITGGKPPAYVPTPAAESTLSELELSQIVRLLEVHAGNRRKVANVLGISERTLYRKVKLYGIKVPMRKKSATYLS